MSQGGYPYRGEFNNHITILSLPREDFNFDIGMINAVQMIFRLTVKLF